MTIPNILTHTLREIEKQSVDSFEIFFKKRSSTQFSSKDQKLENLTQAQDIGLSIRLIKNQRLGFSYTTSLHPKSITQTIDKALEIAQLMPQDSYSNFHSFSKQNYPQMERFDQEGLSVSASEKVNLSNYFESICRKADSRIKSVRSAKISESQEEIHLLDFNGQHIQHSSTLYSASVTCKAEESGDSQMGGDMCFSVQLKNLALKETALLAAESAVELLGAKLPPTLACPVILKNSVVSDLLEFLISNFSIEHIDKGQSMLQNRFGEKVFSDKISIFHDGLLEGGYGTVPFDAEGLPSFKTPIIQNGVFSQPLCDLYYSKKNKIKTTSSSVRGITSAPSIGILNLYLQPTIKNSNSVETNVSSWIKNISQGILITDLLGLHTANSITGDFSVGASGHWIENGKIVRPVKGFAVAGNLIEILNQVVEVGDDLRFFGKVGAPSLFLKELQISS